MSHMPPAQHIAGSQTITRESGPAQCQWNNCGGEFDTTPSLASHLEASHLSSEDGVACKWSGCDAYGVQQESREHLQLHCQAHIGEELICPLPECDETSRGPEELARHIKQAHELQALQEAVFKAKGAQRSDEQMLREIERNHELKCPWWFSSKFVEVLVGGVGAESTKRRRVSDASVPVQALYQLPLDFKQHQVAEMRYKSFVENKSLLFGPGLAPTYNMNIIRRQKLWERLERSGGEEDDQEEELAAANQQFHDQIEKDSDGIKRQYKNPPQENLDAVTDLSELQRVHAQMENRLHTASRINAIVSGQLEQAVKEKRRLWLINQLLVSANVELGIPPEDSHHPQRVTTDKYDDELLNN